MNGERLTEVEQLNLTNREMAATIVNLNRGIDNLKERHKAMVDACHKEYQMQLQTCREQAMRREKHLEELLNEASTGNCFKETRIISLEKANENLNNKLIDLQQTYESEVLYGKQIEDLKQKNYILSRDVQYLYDCFSAIKENIINLGKNTKVIERDVEGRILVIPKDLVDIEVAENIYREQGKIPAIKYVHKNCNCTLRAAKDYIESFVEGY